MNFQRWHLQAGFDLLKQISHDASVEIWFIALTTCPYCDRGAVDIFLDQYNIWFCTESILFWYLIFITLVPSRCPHGAVYSTPSYDDHYYWASGTEILFAYIYVVIMIHTDLREVQSFVQISNATFYLLQNIRYNFLLRPSHFFFGSIGSSTKLHEVLLGKLLVTSSCTVTTETAKSPTLFSRCNSTDQVSQSTVKHTNKHSSS